MAEYRGVNNVAREVVREYRGVDNVTRTVIKAYRGVANVARQYLGVLGIRFRPPSYNGNATADSEFAGFDGNTIRLSYENAVINSGKSEMICRMYLFPNESHCGKTLSFSYTLTGDVSANPVWEVQMRNESGVKLVNQQLSLEPSISTYSRTIPTDTFEIIIGVWSSVSEIDGEFGIDGKLTITNMYIGDEQII